MPFIRFRLKYAGFNRNAYFEHLPIWSDLSAKVKDLYKLPLEYIAVTFTDSDNEEITVSTDEELQNFYRFVYQGEDITLNVVDLSPPRAGLSTPGEFTLQILAHCLILNLFPNSSLSFPLFYIKILNRSEFAVSDQPSLCNRQPHR